MGGVKGREITRNGTVCMYVRGVAVVASVDIPRGLLCLLCLLRVVHNTVLRFDPKAHLLVVRAAFLSMLADGDGDGDGDCLL